MGGDCNSEFKVWEHHSYIPHILGKTEKKKMHRKFNTEFFEAWKHIFWTLETLPNNMKELESVYRTGKCQKTPKRCPSFQTAKRIYEKHSMLPEHKIAHLLDKVGDWTMMLICPFF